MLVGPNLLVSANEHRGINAYKKEFPTGYPQVIHRLPVGYPQVIHNRVGGFFAFPASFPQVFHRPTGIKRGLGKAEPPALKNQGVLFVFFKK